MTTIVYEGEADWHRNAYLKLVDDKVVFDDSNGEYGPIEFDLELLIEALSKHYYAKPISYDEYHRRRDKMAEEQKLKNTKNENKTVTQSRCD